MYNALPSLLPINTPLHANIHPNLCKQNASKDFV